MRNAHIFACNETDCSDRTVVHQDTTNPVKEYLEIALPDVEAKCLGIQLMGKDRQIIMSTVEVYGGRFSVNCWNPATSLPLETGTCRRY